MSYWDEFVDRHGFGDGDAVPDDASRVRRVYIMIINQVAQLLGSGYRVIAMEIPGIHNTCMIETIPTDFYEQLSARDIEWGTADSYPFEIEDGRVGKQDAELAGAIAWAKDNVSDGPYGFLTAPDVEVWKYMKQAKKNIDAIRVKYVME